MVGSGISEGSSWNNTLPCAMNGRARWQSPLLGEGETASFRRILCQLVHWLSGKLTEGHASHCPVEKNH